MGRFCPPGFIQIKLILVLISNYGFGVELSLMLTIFIDVKKGTPGLPGTPSLALLQGAVRTPTSAGKSANTRIKEDAAALDDLLVKRMIVIHGSRWSWIWSTPDCNLLTAPPLNMFFYWPLNMCPRHWLCSLCQPLNTVCFVESSEDPIVALVQSPVSEESRFPLLIQKYWPSTRTNITTTRTNTTPLWVIRVMKNRKNLITGMLVRSAFCWTSSSVACARVNKEVIAIVGLINIIISIMVVIFCEWVVGTE